MIGELGRDDDPTAMVDKLFRSAPFTCLLILFSAREALAECIGRGEPELGGVKAVLLSRVAKERRLIFLLLMRL